MKQWNLPLRQKLGLALLATFLLSLVACGDKKTTILSPNDTEDVVQGQSLFEQVHNSLLKPHCANCHNGDITVPLNFSSLQHSKAAFFTEDDQLRLAYNSVAKQNSWRIVSPGEPRKSFLVRKLQEPGVGEGMPMPSLKMRVSDEAMDLVIRWIEEGALLDSAPLSNLYKYSFASLYTRVTKKLMFEHPVDNCQQCHPQHVEQWQISNHAYAAVDPVFSAMTRMGQRQTQGKLGQFCLQCHSPVGFVRNEAPAELNNETGIYEQALDKLTPVARTGVSCDVCHSTTAVIEPFNAKMSMLPNGEKRGGIRDPFPTDAHDSVYSPLHKTSDVCAPCHNVVNPKGAKLEETFTEWQNSSFTQSPNKKTCQFCHMPESQGPAAKDGPLRTVHDHVMVGVDVSLLAPDEFPGYQELRDKTEALLKSAAKLSSRFIDDGETLEVTLENQTGHALPSGATAERQMWLDVTIASASGEILFESGKLDERGDLMDGNPKHSVKPEGDPQLVKFAQDMLDVVEVPPGENFYEHVVAMPWQALGIKNHLLAADETKSFTYDLQGLEVPIGSTATVILKFRSFPMYFLRVLEDEAELDPVVKSRVPIVEMQSSLTTLE